MNLEEVKKTESVESEVSDKESKKLDDILSGDLVKGAKKENIKVPEYNEYNDEKYEKDINKIIDTVVSSNRNFIKEGENILNGSIKITKEKLLSTNPSIIKLWAIQNNQIIAERKLLIGMRIDNLKDKLAKLEKEEEEGKGGKIKENIIKLNKKLDYYNNKFENINDEINIPLFVNKFEQTQNKLMVYKEAKKTREKIVTMNKPIIINTDNQVQEVGKFIELSEINKQNIKSQLDKAIELKQELVSLEIIGKSDSTGPKSKEIPGEQVLQSLKRLESKGFKIDLLKNVELADGKTISSDEFLNNTDDKNKLNQAWAYARALMQFDFLDKEQLDLMQSSQSLKIKINAQFVGDNSKKGDQYTGGVMKIDTKGNEKVEIREKEEIVDKRKEFDETLKMPNMNIPMEITTTWAMNNPGNISLSFENGKFKIGKSLRAYYADTGEFMASNFDTKKGYIADVTGTDTQWNTPKISLPLDEKDIARKRELWNSNGQTKLDGEPVDRINMQKFVDDLQNYIKKIPENPDAFVSLLEKSLEKTDSIRQKEYIKNIISTIRLYQEVVQI